MKLEPGVWAPGVPVRIRISLGLNGMRSGPPGSWHRRQFLPQHCLYLRPEPQGQGSFRPGRLMRVGA